VPATTVVFDGAPVGGRPSPALVERGIVLVPEGRRIFPSLSVRENLLIGAYRGRRGPWTVERVYELAPLVVKNLYRALEAVKAEGTSLLVVEQDVSQVLAVAQHVYCFRKGGVALDGVPAQLTREQISAAYFGT
jgi:branched-chain amino acid transport system ATP-binding protein